MKLANTISVTAILLSTLSAAVIISSQPANAGLWDSMMNSDLKEVPTTANYEMEVYGFDARVYEWTPAWNEGISCVFVSANKSSGVACYPKAAQ